MSFVSDLTAIVSACDVTDITGTGTPLTLILGPAHVLSTDSKLNHSQQSQVSLINRNAKRLLRLVNSILDVCTIHRTAIHVHLSDDTLSIRVVLSGRGWQTQLPVYPSPSGPSYY
jgi:signal transduction histidine kinase